jgi:molybdate transport system ATP-binding protein
MSVEIALRATLGSFSLDVAFAVERPGITALFGPSGAGKTSIINGVAGLLVPHEGRISINGRVVLDTASDLFVPARSRHVGYVFQDAKLFPHMTVRTNLLFGWRRSTRRAPAEEIERLTVLLGLTALLHRAPRALSGGERQRVALGRALLASPDILLLDEPMASLDHERRAEILPYLERLRDEAKLPMLYVSHSTDEVARLANDVVIISNGRVAGHGSVFDVMPDIDPSASVVIAACTGPRRDDGLTVLHFDGGELIVQQLTTTEGAEVRARIGAQDVMLAREEPRGISANNVLAARIADIRDAASGLADVHLLVGATRLVARITRSSLNRLALTPGQPVYAVIKAVTVDTGARRG